MRFLQAKKLQCQEAIELGVLGFVNDAHATFAELFEDFVMRNGRS